MKKQRRRILPRGDINVTPFIDILLVLLVIFMTITPNASRGLNTTIPLSAPLDHPQEESVVVLSMDQAGVLKINQDTVSPSDLIGRLQEIFKRRNDRTVFVQASEKLLFNDVAQLIDSARGAGVDRIGLMTEQIFNK
jgi:biopolymer transport protein ExbD/biopolymer transport protein TolR